MRYLVTGKEMKLLDQNTSEHFHVPTIVLMEQAAMTFVRELFAIVQPNKVLVVCGRGNNGADGVAIARLLNQHNVNTSVFYVDNQGSKKGTDSFELQKQIYSEYAYNVVDSIAKNDSYDVIIDAIFGIGLSRDVLGAYAQAIEVMNEMSGLKVAVDMASGISSDTGELLGIAFRADYTITFSFGKLGQYLWPGTDYSGKVIVTPMGITADSFLDKKPWYVSLENTDLDKLPKRYAHSNKGSYGKLLIIGGSKNMAGAVCFSAKAAYRTGVGLVKVMADEDNRSIIQSNIPEAVFQGLADKGYEDLIIEGLKWADAVVLGPGLGTEKRSTAILKTVVQNINVPLLLDADALNIISNNTDILLRPHLDIIVTPHLGEMARLTGDAVSFIQTHLIDEAKEFAQRYDVICVLKDFHTIVASPYSETYINLSGNDGMATAGSGDVLTGIIGAFMSQGMKVLDAAAYGVFIHGLAGDNIFPVTKGRGMIASDIIEGIKSIW